MSNSLDPDQARQFVGPDLGPNCLQRLSADISGKELNEKQLVDTFGLKPWLKLIHFAPTFSIWLKCWLPKNSTLGIILYNLLFCPIYMQQHHHMYH